ncbi:DEAD/DEAH box helicase [Rhodoferax sp.]|uniref:DEAD/DEAH box helicase n=1 Tax=Rhodoferax sp. TaxID=50421 RepID=UPI0025EEFC53|nr:DEAD/DEAH box helicase [Rhodoferax sp.]
MNDSFDVAGDFSPAANFSSANDTFVTETLLSVEGADVAVAAEADAAPALPNGFVTLGLAPELVQAVADLGYTQPTAVQMQTIPMAMQGESARFVDLMVSSQTGSGKTAAFLLPVLHTLLRQQAEAEAAEKAEYEAAVAEAAANGEAAPKRAKRKDPTNARNFKAATPGALILCPTRELAQQVAHDAIGLVAHCRGLRVANVVGGMPYQLQIAKLQNANLVVATPGRLLDLQRSQQIKLDQVQFLVVDEADRMLDLGFSDDLADVNQMTIGRKQTMMFSATFAPRIQQLAQRVMREPQRVTIDSPQEKHQNIKQILFWADNAQHKRKLLDHWLRDTSIAQAIVFASTQIECDGLAADLQQEGFSAVALHGALSQGLRNRRLMALRQGQVQILVATDVAARGIDVPSISHVFNFGLPMKAEDYTHRIGRTGRAGRDGIAVTFAEMRDRRKIFDIESYSHQQFKAEVIPGMEPQQRQPDSRPPRAGGGGFGGGSRDGAPRGRSFGPSPRGNDRGGFGGGGNGGGFGGDRGGQRDGGSYGGASGFNDRNSRPPARTGGFQGNGGGFGGDRGAPRGDFAPRGDRADFAPRSDFAPRPDFAPRGERTDFAPRGDRAERGDFNAPRPAFSKPAFSKPGVGAGNGGKVFVPRDTKKRLAPKPAR